MVQQHLVMPPREQRAENAGALRASDGAREGGGRETSTKRQVGLARFGYTGKKAGGRPGSSTLPQGDPG